MARTNKYTSINFNDIYDKKVTSPSSSSPAKNPAAGKTALANSRIHGHMLVLSKPAAKPKPTATPPPSFPSPSKVADQTGPKPDSISLRPQGRTGSGSPVALSPAKPGSPLPKSDRFVPPHLRPGFVGREEKPIPQDGRPKSGGGYERMRRIAEPEHFARPGSSG